MNALRKILFSSLLFLTLSSSLGNTQCPGELSPIRYHSLGHSQIGVPVMINGRGPYEFLLDTGAQLTVVEPSLAAELHLPARGSVGVISVTHYADAPIDVAERVEAGSMLVEHAIVAIAKLGRLKDLYPNIGGKLGESFLSHFDLLIDYPHKILCLDEGGAMREQIHGERVPVVAQQSQPASLPIAPPILVFVQLNSGDSRATTLRLDSGTNIAFLNAGHLEAPFWKQMQSAKQCAVMSGAQVPVTNMPPQDLRVGTRWLRGVAFMTPVRTRNTVTIPGEDGLLPTNLFKRVFISHGSHFVIFEPSE